ncbi:sulfotransferase [Nocardioides sp. URHA0032]|uniref:sulfotransferase n=1 Tax=Nocardioides sp. URHA0032 TaxID=1380388 RepID=UPI000687CC91|nr:sulfotransferase [Nocardioides sp. URHA0032]
MKVLYIAGVGRSGSTLLERMLGALPGCVNTGELNAIFSRVISQDQRCGCGEPFSACPFWTAVGEQAFGGWESVTDRMCRLQQHLVRQRRVPQLAAGVAGPDFRHQLADYLDGYQRLYRAIAQVSGADVVVDASKSAAQLVALRRLRGLDLRVLHLVRDPRGVAHSWTKSGIRKPQSRDGDTMATYPPHRLAVLWTTLEIECGAVAASVPHAARVRYEDLVARPRPTLARAVAALGLSTDPAALDHVGERSVVLEPSHGIAGSRSRFVSGRVELRLDDAWRSSLPVGARRMVTAVTLPHLLGYGYVGRRSDLVAPGAGS